MATLKVGERHAAGLSRNHASKSQSSDKDLFNAIREELDAVASSSAIAQADAGVAGGTYNQAQVQTIVDLANALKTALNSISNLVKKYEK